jgi:putative ABC transport system permease protein
MSDFLMQDLRYSFRILRKNLGFTVVAVLALALGIGANTAIFSMVNAILLRQLDFKDPERLVWIWSTRTDRDKAFFSIPDFIDHREQAQTLEQIVAWANWGANLTDGGNPERLYGVRVTANAFQMLDVQAAVGRCLLPEDGQPGSQRTVVLSNSFWQRRFGGDQGIIGQTITLNGDSYTVVGVLPPHFLFPGAEIDMASPLILETDPRRSDRGANFLRVFAKLKPGIARQQVQGEMNSISRNLKHLYPETNAKKTPPKVFPLHEEVVGSYRTGLVMLLGAVGLVLLIACSNLASLLLSRASARHKEMAIRVAVGASRRRLIRQLLTETSVLSLIGGLLGLFLAWRGVDFLMALSPSNLPRAGEVGIDGRVLAFTIIVSLLAGVIFGLIPALHASKVDLNDELKGAGKGSSDGSRRDRARSFLVVAEIALCLVLLITAGLLVKSFLRLQEVSPGFNGENLLLVRLSLPPSRYSKREDSTVFFDKALLKIATLPGVRSVGAANVLPISGMNVRSDFMIAGRPLLSPTDKPAAQSRLVSPDYFQALGIPILNGRDFTEQDNAQTAGVVIIDSALAQRYWPDENPVGAHLLLEDGSPQPRDVEIVGVCETVKHVSLDEEPTPTYYVPIAQASQDASSFLAANCSLAIRTTVKPLTLESAVRNAVQSVDADVPISNTRTMEHYLSASSSSRRFNLLLLTIFACTALLLAMTGVYAVISYSVSRRYQEIGIRIALGAQSSDVIKLILGHGLKLVGIGILIGIAGASIATQFISSLLFGVSAIDPITFALTTIVLLVVAVLACYIPARKALRVDPMIALRAE